VTAVRLPALPWAAEESGPRWDVRRCATCAGSLLGAVGRARFTVTYLGVLLWTTVLQRHLSAAQARSLLAASSTDVWHLTHRPLLVLIESALWLPGARWWPYAIIFLLVMVPLERRVGIRRLLLIFLSGHVLATLLTELPLAVGIALGWFPAGAADRLDVGASYGTLAVVGAAATVLRPQLRWIVLPAAVGSVLVPIAVDPGLTAVGHVVALAVGLACWRWLRPRTSEASYGPPRSAVIRLLAAVDVSRLDWLADGTAQRDASVSSGRRARGRRSRARRRVEEDACPC
jgi:hypothetical protein